MGGGGIDWVGKYGRGGIGKGGEGGLGMVEVSGDKGVGGWEGMWGYF